MPQIEAKAYNNNNKQSLKSDMTEYSLCKQKGQQQTIANVIFSKHTPH